MRFRIAEELWDGARPERTSEWQHTLMDLNMKHDGNPPEVTVRRREDGGASLVLEGLQPEPLEVQLTFDMLRDHFRDYREVIARLARADLGSFGMRDWEALDMAKKGVHDEAGMRIRKALRPHLEVDLKLARRIFTLVFLVVSDIPAELVKRHRRHGTPQ
jgi:hypothetical protein